MGPHPGLGAEKNAALAIKIIHAFATKPLPNPITGQEVTGHDMVIRVEPILIFPTVTTIVGPPSENPIPIGMSCKRLTLKRGIGHRGTRTANRRAMKRVIGAHQVPLVLNPTATSIP